MPADVRAALGFGLGAAARPALRGVARSADTRGCADGVAITYYGIGTALLTLPPLLLLQEGSRTTSDIAPARESPPCWCGVPTVSSIGTPSAGTLALLGLASFCALNPRLRSWYRRSAAAKTPPSVTRAAGRATAWTRESTQQRMKSPRLVSNSPAVEIISTGH